MTIFATNILRYDVAHLGAGLRSTCLHLPNKKSIPSRRGSSNATRPALKRGLPPNLHMSAKANAHVPPSSTRSSKSQITCWIDAAPSTRLIAVVNETHREYELFDLRPGWKSGGKDINWAEAIGFELAAQCLIARGYTGGVIVKCDSTTALRAFSGNRKLPQHLKEVGLRLESGRKEWPFTMSAQWVQGRYNLADAFSREKKIQGYKRTKCAVKIPEELKKFVSRRL